MARKTRPRQGAGARRRPMDRRAMERALWDIERIVRERPFASIDEMNAFLRAHSGPGRLPAPPPSTPLEQAQDLMYKAWDATGRRRVSLARQALARSEDCADAYVLLAEEEARSLEEAHALYERGVRAGERAIGPEHMREWTGQFWGMIETRPYMRARAGLASTLWHLGRREEAVAHYREMLRLNPGDNQGLRYVLASCLLAMGEDEALGKLLDEYPGEPTAEWLYTRALWLFRTQGAGSEAEAALNGALSANPFVVGYLVAIERLPSEQPEYITIGGEDEAQAYVGANAAAWYDTEGAIEWFVRAAAARIGADDLGLEPDA